LLARRPPRQKQDEKHKWPKRSRGRDNVAVRRREALLGAIGLERAQAHAGAAGAGGGAFSAFSSSFSSPSAAAADLDARQHVLARVAVHLRAPQLRVARARRGEPLGVLLRRAHHGVEAARGRGGLGRRAQAQRAAAARERAAEEGRKCRGRQSRFFFFR